MLFQDLLERAYELDQRYAAQVCQDSIETSVQNQILRARIRSALAALQSSLPLKTHFVDSGSDPLLSPSRSHSCVTQVMLFTLLTFIALSFLLFVQIAWLSEDEIRFHRSCGNHEWVFCFTSFWSNSLCMLFRIPSPPSPGHSNKVPPPT